ncbi:phage tail spike protein [Staphylococcus equorum]|uniref:phage tail spike protein n=1 Tax=Staphylococcus equorum TaxID=246432 RepID=UPI003FD8C4A0
MFIRDLQNNEYFLQGVVKHDQELNGDERIDIDIGYTDMNAEFLSKQDDLKMWIILFEGKEYRIISSKQTGFGNKYQISITAVLYMLDWLNTSRIYQRIDGSLTVTEAFNIVFNDTPFTYSTVESAPSNSFEGIGEGETRIEIFKKFIDRYGYEFNIVGNVVYLQNKLGNDANFEYRYKVNTQDITKEVDASEMWTHAKGFGNYSDDDTDTDVIDKAKLKREYTSPLADIIGIREAPPIRDGRVTKQATMDANLKKIVDESVQISFTADIYDMSQQGYNYQHAVIGDRVFLVDERIGLDTEIRVVKISKSVNDLEQILDMEITFGTGNIADQYGSNLSTAAKDIADLIQGRKSLPFQALDIISKSMVTKIQNTTSEIIYDTNGQHFMDKKNNNNIMTMNSSGLLLSTDGGRTAKTAITAEGIMADTITSGSLLTSLVDIVGRNGLITMNGDEFVAKSNLDKRKTVISPNGLEVTRPDGAVWIQNGLFKSAMDIQMTMPPLEYEGVRIQSGYYITANTEKSYIEECFFQHKARYLRLLGRGKMKHLTNDEYSGVVYIEDNNNENRFTVGSHIVYSDNGEDDNGTLVDLTVDLGVPDYKYKHFYLMMKTTNKNSEIQFRRSLMELKDF